MMQLFLKTLLGQSLGLITITCNHCGYKGCWIEGLKDGNGHWVYCPKCKKTDVHVFPEGYDTCMDTIKSKIITKTDELQIDPRCKYKFSTPEAEKDYKKFKESIDKKYKHAAKNSHDPGANPKPKKPKPDTSIIATLGENPKLSYKTKCPFCHRWYEK